MTSPSIEGLFDTFVNWSAESDSFISDFRESSCASTSTIEQMDLFPQSVARKLEPVMSSEGMQPNTCKRLNSPPEPTIDSPEERIKRRRTEAQERKLREDQRKADLFQGRKAAVCDWRKAYHAAEAKTEQMRIANSKLQADLTDARRAIARLETSNAYLLAMNNWVPYIEQSARDAYVANKFYLPGPSGPSGSVQPSTDVANAFAQTAEQQALPDPSSVVSGSNSVPGQPSSLRDKYLLPPMPLAIATSKEPKMDGKLPL